MFVAYVYVIYRRGSGMWVGLVVSTEVEGGD